LGFAFVFSSKVQDLAAATGWINANGIGGQRLPFSRLGVQI
jgi:hypothetical protein